MFPVLPFESVTNNTSSTTKSAAELSSVNDSSNADNDIEFEPDKTTSDRKANTTTTETTTKNPHATDKDGWNTKWYYSIRGGEKMSVESYLKYAYELFNKAVDAEGSTRQYYLQQAKNVLENVPNGYPGRSELLSKINSMLY